MYELQEGRSDAAPPLVDPARQCAEIGPDNQRLLAVDHDAATCKLSKRRIGIYARAHLVIVVIERLP